MLRVGAQAVYGTAKHGLRGWSLSCHEALRKHGVKVVIIEPGDPVVCAQLFSTRPCSEPGPEPGPDSREKRGQVAPYITTCGTFKTWICDVC